MNQTETSRLLRFWDHPIHSSLGLVIRLLVGGVFIYAAIPKILHPGDFAWSIALYQMLHYSKVNALAVILPWVELVAGLALLLGLRTKAAALLVCGMLVMFIAALAHAISQGIEMTTCGCFSQAGARALSAHRHEVGTSLLYRDLAMFLATGYVWLFDQGKIGLDGLFGRMAARRRHHTDKSAQA